MPFKFNALTGNFDLVNDDTLGGLAPTKGNLAVGNGSDWTVLGVGSNNQVLTADSAQTLGIKWASGGGGWNFPVSNATAGYVKDYFFLYEDFVRSTQNTYGNVIQVASGSASGTTQNWNINAAQAGTHPGYLNFQTGSSSTGYVFVTARTHPSADLFLLGGGTFVFECSVNVYELADATNDYDIRLGLLESDLSSTNGVFFEYSRASATTWTGVCQSGGSRDTVTGGTVTAGAWIRLTFVVNAAASSVEFFADGSSLGSVSTQIPTSNLQPICGIIKTAGTTNKSGLTMDYMVYAQEISAGR